ncbi:hypothetical protein ACWGNZ_19260 (plasmid) [Sphingomonas zeae]
MHSILEMYGYDPDPFGIDGKDDAELSSRARCLTTYIGSLKRRLARFEDFFNRVDREALGRATVEEIIDHAGADDLRLQEATVELDDIEQSLMWRRLEKAHPGLFAGDDNPCWP